MLCVLVLVVCGYWSIVVIWRFGFYIPFSLDMGWRSAVAPARIFKYFESISFTIYRLFDVVNGLPLKRN